MKTKLELLAEAKLLKAQASQAEAYMRSMERTTQKTGGTFGHLNNPHQYAAHEKRAAELRLKAAHLEAEADAIQTQDFMVRLPPELHRWYLQRAHQTKLAGNPESMNSLAVRALQEFAERNTKK